MSPVASLCVVLAVCYLGLAVVSGGARHMIRSIMYHPWRFIASGAFSMFPTSRWRGPFRVIRAPFALSFAGMVLAIFAVFAVGVEILFSPRTIWWSFNPSAN